LQRHRRGQRLAVAVSREPDLVKRRHGQITASPVGQALVEIVVDPPVCSGRIEDQDLRSLPPLWSRRVLPIAVAGVEFAGVPGEDPHLGAAYEPAGIIPRPRFEGNSETCR